MRKKTPKFEDKLFIRLEIRYILNTLYICIFLTILLILFYFIFYVFELYQAITYIAICGYFMFSTTAFIIILITTKYILFKLQSYLMSDGGDQAFNRGRSMSRTLFSMDISINSKPKEGTSFLERLGSISAGYQMELSQASNTTTMMSVSVIGNRELKEEEKIDNVLKVEKNIFREKNSIHLRDVLKNEASFLSFMRHLRYEFSVENLLFFYEISYFRKYIKSYFSKYLKIKNVSGGKKNEFIFPCNLAKPLLIYDLFYEENFLNEKKSNLSGSDESLEAIIIKIDDETVDDERKISGNEESIFREDLKEKAHQIYEKYIRVGSEFEINISFSLRNGYIFLFANYEEWMEMDAGQMSINDLYELFETCMLEIFRFLMQSFTRYKLEHKQQLSKLKSNKI